MVTVAKMQNGQVDLTKRGLLILLHQRRNERMFKYPVAYTDTEDKAKAEQGPWVELLDKLFTQQI